MRLSNCCLLKKGTVPLTGVKFFEKNEARQRDSPLFQQAVQSRGRSDMKRVHLFVCLLLLPVLLAGVAGCGEDPSTKPRVIKGGFDSEKGKPQQNATVKIMQ
jgi:hypothetical protein